MEAQEILIKTEPFTVGAHEHNETVDKVLHIADSGLSRGTWSSCITQQLQADTSEASALQSAAVEGDVEVQTVSSLEGRTLIATTDLVFSTHGVQTCDGVSVNALQTEMGTSAMGVFGDMSASAVQTEMNASFASGDTFSQIALQTETTGVEGLDGSGIQVTVGYPVDVKLEIASPAYELIHDTAVNFHQTHGASSELTETNSEGRTVNAISESFTESQIRIYESPTGLTLPDVAGITIVAQPEGLCGETQDNSAVPTGLYKNVYVKEEPEDGTSVALASYAGGPCIDFQSFVVGANTDDFNVQTVMFAQELSTPIQGNKGTRRQRPAPSISTVSSFSNRLPVKLKGSHQDTASSVKLKKKALSPAERQRRYRARRDADPDRRALYLLTQKHKYCKDKMSGKRKLVSDMSEKEHKQAKRKWKLRKQRQKKRNRGLLNAATMCTSSASNAVPSESATFGLSRRESKSLTHKSFNPLVHAATGTINSSSGRTHKGVNLTSGYKIVTSKKPSACKPVASKPSRHALLNSKSSAHKPCEYEPSLCEPFNSEPQSIELVSSTPPSKESTSQSRKLVKCTPQSGKLVNSAPQSRKPVNTTPPFRKPVNSMPLSSAPVSSTPPPRKQVNSTPPSRKQVSSTPPSRKQVSSTPPSRKQVNYTPPSSKPVSSAELSSNWSRKAPLSAAEKQRRYRARRNADPERRTSYLLKEKDKYWKDKVSGKRKPVSDMSPREHKLAKQKWRLYKQERRRLKP